ncbi:MAG: glutathione S-transferase family protein [Hyphomonadaceae bacterium]
MIELYAFATPNSVKVLIALEELSLPYMLNSVDLRQGAQNTPTFLALNPNGKVPVIVEELADGTRFSLSESAAILVYLAEKTGQLLPAASPARERVFEQLFFHASSLAPTFSNLAHFTRSSAGSDPAALHRFRTETERILNRLDTLLAMRSYVSGDDFSIADIAHFGWFWRRDFIGVDISGLPNLSRWCATLEQKPSIQRAITRLAGAP